MNRHIIEILLVEEALDHLAGIVESYDLGVNSYRVNEPPPRTALQSVP